MGATGDTTRERAGLTLVLGATGKTGRRIAAGLEARNVPLRLGSRSWLMGYLFSMVLDGRNARFTAGVERALGRPPRDFTDFAREVAATGVWTAAA